MFGLLAVILAISSSLIAAAPVPTKPAFREHREAESDLKITGLIQDVPRGQSRFVPWKFLASLPEHEAIVAHNQNFPDLPQGALKIGGIYLDSLAEVLGAGRSTDVIEAVCKDGYTSTYTTEYVNQHHPIFALTVAGLTAHEWAKRNHQYDPGPYFITYEQFVPAFQILSHVDRPQEPAEVVELHFDKVERVYGSITPKQSDAHHPRIERRCKAFASHSRTAFAAIMPASMAEPRQDAAGTPWRRSQPADLSTSPPGSIIRKPSIRKRRCRRTWSMTRLRSMH